MSQLNVAVIGAGHLGKIHARLVQQLDQVNLVGVVDPSPKAQQQIIDEHAVEVCSDYRKLLDQIDAAIIATPTRHHYSIAMGLIEAGKHLLIEKPVTDSVRDAQSLVETADQHGVVVSVGHVERFNPAIQAALQQVGTPRLIQASRMSGFTFRSTDIGVVHDLMIHDIDLVNSIFPGELESVTATGVNVIGDSEDISQANLRFACGGVANLTASRCSFKNERSFQIFGTEGYASVDLAESRVTIVKAPQWLRQRKYDLLDVTPEQQEFIRDNLFTRILPKSEIDVPRCNAILNEQQDWIETIARGGQPRVSLAQGAAAVEVAQQVLDGIACNAWNQDRQTTAAGGRLGIFSPELVSFPEVEAETARKRAA